MFQVYGSSALGCHSDVENRGDRLRQRQRRTEHERDIPHGPVRILVKDGRPLDPPEIVTVRKTEP